MYTVKAMMPTGEKVYRSPRQQSVIAFLRWLRPEDFTLSAVADDEEGYTVLLRVVDGKPLEISERIKGYQALRDYTKSKYERKLKDEQSD